jgi:hypothetical protein
MGGIWMKTVISKIKLPNGIALNDFLEIAEEINKKLKSFPTAKLFVMCEHGDIIIQIELPHVKDKNTETIKKDLHKEIRGYNVEYSTWCNMCGNIACDCKPD